MRYRLHMCQRIDTTICDVTALHQSNSPQFWQLSKLLDRLVSKPRAAPEIDISDPSTMPYNSLDRLIGDQAAVAEMKVMQVLAQCTDREDGLIGKISAFG